jgi:hypothetical protein
MVPTGSLPANCSYDCHATRTSRSLLCMAVRCATGRANTHLATNHTRRRKRGGLPVASGICVRKQPTRCNEEDCQSDGRGTGVPARRAHVTKRQRLAPRAIVLPQRQQSTMVIGTPEAPHTTHKLYQIPLLTFLNSQILIIYCVYSCLPHISRRRSAPSLRSFPQTMVTVRLELRDG